MDWQWFRTGVERKLEPILQKHGLHRLTGKAYEPDENQDTHDGFFYAHVTDDRPFLGVDILEWSRFVAGEIRYFYWLRVETREGYLDRRSLGDPDLEVNRGWIVNQAEELDANLEDAAVVLEAYLSSL